MSKKAHHDLASRCKGKSPFTLSDYGQPVEIQNSTGVLTSSIATGLQTLPQKTIVVTSSLAQECVEKAQAYSTVFDPTGNVALMWVLACR